MRSRGGVMNRLNFVIRKATDELAALDGDPWLRRSDPSNLVA